MLLRGGDVAGCEARGEGEHGQRGRASEVLVDEFVPLLLLLVPQPVP